MDLSERYQINIPSVENKRLRRLLQKKIDSKTKPYGALGFLESIAMQAGLLQQSLTPTLKKPTLLIFAADHGIVQTGVSTFSKEVTYQVVLNFLNEGSAINVFAKNAGIALRLVDVGVDHAFEGTLTYWLHHGAKVQSRKIGMGTKNFLEFPAMTTAEAEKAMETGRKLVQKEKDKGCNNIGFGDIAVGNFSSGIAICCAMFERESDYFLPSLQQDSNNRLDIVLETVNKALRIHPKTHDPLTILTLYGGFEIAAMVGSILAAAQLRMLVYIDGFVSTVALLLAERMAPGVKEYCVVCQNSGGIAHDLVLEKLKKQPILDLKVNIGEGCGVALAYPIVKNAVDFLNEMTAFSDTVSNKPKD